jgi:hypothetical protein
VSCGARRPELQVVEEKLSQQSLPEEDGYASMSDRVEKVARALCYADGSNPDARHSTGQMETVRTSPNCLETREITVPLWHTHVAEARRLVAAFEALTAS